MCHSEIERLYLLIYYSSWSKALVYHLFSYWILHVAAKSWSPEIVSGKPTLGLLEDSQAFTAIGLFKFQLKLNCCSLVYFNLHIWTGSGVVGFLLLFFCFSFSNKKSNVRKPQSYKETCCRNFVEGGSILFLKTWSTKDCYMLLMPNRYDARRGSSWCDHV